VDSGWRGAKASRPEFDRLMRDAGKLAVEVILCWKLDRFGRSLLHCKMAIEQLRAHGVRLISTSQDIDTDESNPTSRLLLHVLMAAAQFERELIHERSVLGQKHYRAQYEASKVVKEVHSKSGKDLRWGGPKASLTVSERLSCGSRASAIGRLPGSSELGKPFDVSSRSDSDNGWEFQASHAVSSSRAPKFINRW